MGRSVTVRVPASSANLGPGFDSLGIALDLTGDVRVSLLDHPAPRPENRGDALALEAARAVFSRAGTPMPDGLQAEYRGELPVGRGLGASAVLNAGGALAANRLLGDPLTPDQVLLVATELEGHADNVAPALFGGFQVVVYDGSAVTRVQVPLPDGLQAVVLVPDLEMPTHESRKLLPATLTRAEVVHNVGRAALLVAAMATGRLDVLRVATQDVLHQPARAKLFPALFDVIDAALGAGAVCSFLSGGGSAVLALTTERPVEAGEAMIAAAKAHGTTARYLLTAPRACGARIVSDGPLP
jgi:homoserine kinase